MRTLRHQTNKFKKITKDGIFYTQMGRVDIMKMAVLSKAFYRVLEIFIKIQCNTSQKQKKKLKIQMETQKT